MRWLRTRVMLAALLGATIVGCVGDPAAEDDFGFEVVDAPAVEVITEPGEFPQRASTRFVDISKLEAAREDWVNRSIDNYSYTAVIFLEGASAPVGCGAGGGRTRVEVVNGKLVAATALEEACSIDVDSPSRPPLTPEEVYTFAIELGAESGGVEFALGEQSFPQLIFVEGPDGFMQFEVFELELGVPERVAVDGEDLAAARTLWARVGIDEYTIEVEEGGELIVGEQTVDGLFDLIEQRLGADAGSVSAQYNPNGIPIGIVSDGQPDLKVLSFIPDAARDVDLAEVLAAVGANMEDAPERALTLGDARFCGVDRTRNEGGFDGDPIARRCLTSGYERGIPSVLVRSTPTIEGAPLVGVVRAESESVTEFLDSSQDPLGSFGWHERTCSGAEAIRPSTSSLVEGFTLGC